MIPAWFGARDIRPDDLRHDGNIFTIERLVLSSAVLFAHGWDLTQPRPDLDPFVPWISFSTGRLAVFLFFTLSGFLVVGSLLKRGVAHYALSRALRMLPGLWVMLLVLPPLLWWGFGTTTWAAFIGSSETWAFVWRNATGVVGRAYSLPGLFQDQPYKIVNGSLWTIRYEIYCYITLALLFSVGLLRSRALFTGLTLAGFAVHLALPYDLIPALVDARPLAFSFFMGVLAWLWRDRLKLSWPLALIGVAIALALPHWPQLKIPAIQISFAYLLLVAAFHVPQRLKTQSDAVPDYSYGIYIYGMPAQQAVLALGADTPGTNIVFAMALTVAAAALSWHFIEKPALALKPAPRPLPG